MKRPPRMQELAAPAVLLAGVGAAVLLAFAAGIANGPVWDDVPLVTANPYLRSVHGLVHMLSSDLWSASGQGEPSSYYRPLAMLTFWVNAHFGTSAPAFRAGNVILHATNAALLAILIQSVSLVGKRTAAAIAVLWALSPVVSEPVYWISGRFDLLVATFAMSALLFGRARRPGAEALSTACVVAGLLCKESFIGVLPIVVLDDLWIRKVRFRSCVAKYAAMLAVTGGYFAMRRALRVPSVETVTTTGPAALTRSFLFLVRTYFGEFVFPAHLDPFRPYVAPSWPEATATAIALALAGTLAFFLATRFERAGAATLGWLWYAASLGPIAVVGPNLDMVGDRYAYMPTIGLALFGSGLAKAFFDRLGQRAWPVAATVGLWGAATLAEGWCTARRARDWVDDVSLARASLRSHPNNPYALYSLGAFAAERGEYEDAGRLLHQSLAADHHSWRAWDALCFVQMQRDEFEEAVRACVESLSRHPDNPRVWVNLASVHAKAHRWLDGARAAERALALKPAYAQGHYMAALCTANLGDLPLARSHVKQGLDADPRHSGLRALRDQLARAE